jgi:hypothetical protein
MVMGPKWVLNTKLDWPQQQQASWTVWKREKSFILAGISMLQDQLTVAVLLYRINKIWKYI